MMRSPSGAISLRENQIVTYEMKKEAGLPQTTFGVGRHCLDKVVSNNGWNN